MSEKFEEQQQQKQQTVPAEEINITVDFESDESIGQLIYSDSELLWIDFHNFLFLFQMNWIVLLFTNSQKCSEIYGNETWENMI